MTIQKIHTLQIGNPDQITIILAGCGGTGSFAALNLARLAYASQDTRKFKLIFVDPDHVEAKNIGRQYFAPADIGQPKSLVLAHRLALAFGLEIIPLVQEFHAQLINDHRPSYSDQGGLTLIVGAVDTPAARKTIAAAIESKLPDSMHRHTELWWLDAGNHHHTGQVLLGNSLNPRPLITKFGEAVALPMPHIQEPDLIEPENPVGQAVSLSTLSCADLVLLDIQARTINYHLAAWLDLFIERFIIAHNLNLMGVEINQKTGHTRGLPITNGLLLEDGQTSDDLTGPPTDPNAPLCPLCQVPAVYGQNDEGAHIIDIVFCPACNWQMPQEEFEDLYYNGDADGLFTRILQLEPEPAQ